MIFFANIIQIFAKTINVFKLPRTFAPVLLIFLDFLGKKHFSENLSISQGIKIVSQMMSLCVRIAVYFFLADDDLRQRE